MTVRISHDPKSAQTKLQFVLPDDVHDGPVSAVGVVTSARLGNKSATALPRTNSAPLVHIAPANPLGPVCQPLTRVPNTKDADPPARSQP